MEIEPGLRPPRVENPATRYGVWWHEFAQKIPWRSRLGAWQATFTAHVSDSPDQARSKREWELLAKYTSDHPKFFGANVFAELPFVWRKDGQTCVEGLIDVALFQPDEKQWFILDWKTNRVARDDLGSLRLRYRPQIAAYWKALAEMTKQPVRAGIYSTATGELMVYSEIELAEEWERLKAMG
jgi:ATP-dependent exoDNAse (exonuclease V) beta subunit